MPDSTMKTPGVYIVEKNAFPNAVVAVPTAVPAFIGYTPQAEYDGKTYFNRPCKITSFAEFQAIFCLPDPIPPADPVQQYSPQYYLEQSPTQPPKGDHLMIDGEYYSICVDPNTVYYLYNSIRLFYQNGGGDTYIVSMGSYGPASGEAEIASEPLVNPNVKLSDLQTGVALLKNETEPTIYICPEATLLTTDDNATLMQSMLLQNEDMGTAVSIFDIIGGRNPDPILYTDDIQNFRNSTGNQGLSYGISYYPFIGTSIMQPQELDFTNLFGGDIKQLLPLLSPASDPNPVAEQIIEQIQEPPAHPLTTTQLDSALTTASKTYSLIKKHIFQDINRLPASGAMAGVYTHIDNRIGVWKAPANVSIVGATHLPIELSHSQQSGLNVDAVSGKSINAIRFFNGEGILVWGARTLDGNSTDWRYISVRRTLIMLEQSVKQATRAYVFEPNDTNTWNSVKNMITHFLTLIWKQGGLQGATPSDAFHVQCGLGSTMTPEDILNGNMNIMVAVAVTRPAEFIIINFTQQMAKPD